MNKPAIRQIGRYQLLDVIGQGGMGIVYKATDASIGRTVAIKMLHGAYAEDKDLLARFHREVRFTANLQHKNIVTVYALDDFEGFPYMVMEYLEGESMADMIASRRPLHIADKIGLVCQICEGLQYAHERNVIHRDIKPANILVLKDGTAKIVDFGIARIERGETLTRAGQIIGSIFYMSPEQITGALIDSRTDIYSAGATLFQFLTGELPFKCPETDLQTVSVKILNDPVPSLDKYLPAYPAILDEILGKAMAKAPDARYQSAEDFGYDLTRLEEQIKRGMTEEFLAQAQVAIARKEWEVARQQLQEILRIEKRHDRANDLYQLVRQEIQKQQRSVQITHLRSQAQIALIGLQYEEALECISQARRLDPNDNELIELSRSIEMRIENARELAEVLRRGQAALYAGDLTEAASAVHRALQIESNHTEARALESLIKKELEERSRRVTLQGFVEEARREISSHNFLSALRSLEKAHAIDSTDSNVLELLSWARRGHEQEKLRAEHQKWASEIGQLLKEHRYADAMSVSEEALRRFPEDASLIKLSQLAERQQEQLLRRQATEEIRTRARNLVEAKRSGEAIEILEQALKEFPGDPSLQTLLIIIKAECEHGSEVEGELDQRAATTIDVEPSDSAFGYTRQEALQLLGAFEDGLARNLSIGQLRVLAVPLVEATKVNRLPESGLARCAVLLEELEARSKRRDRDVAELDDIDKAIRQVKASGEIAAFWDRARLISEQHGLDEGVREAYRRIREFFEEIKQRREATCARISELLRSMQLIQKLNALAETEREIQEISALWLDDPFVRDLAGQASARIEEVRHRSDELLQELVHLEQSLSNARSVGEIRILEEQARMMSAESEGLDLERPIDNFLSDAQKKRLRFDRIITQLKEIAVRCAASSALAEVERCGAAAHELVSDSSDCEEATELIRRILHGADAKKKEHRRVSSSLEQLVEGAAGTSSHGELDLIMARRRDLLKNYPTEVDFKEILLRLESVVSERRSKLAEIAAADETCEVADSTTPNPSATDPGIAIREGQAVSGAQPVSTLSELQREPRIRLLRFGLLALGVASAAALTSLLVAPKSVTIQTEPEGARISVDGQSCGNPCRIRLRPGRHGLIAEQPGFKRLHQDIRIPWFGTALPVLALSELPKQPLVSPPPIESRPPAENDARILVRTSMPGASVFVDGSQIPAGRTGKNGRFEFATAAGLHQVRVEKSGFETDPAQMVTAEKNAQAVVSFPLKPLPGPQAVQATEKPTVSIPKVEKSSPSPAVPATAEVETYLVIQAPVGAEIHIDQQLAGHSTGGPFKSKVQPGQRTVEVFLAGFQPYSHTLSISAGQQEELIANLAPVPQPNVSSTTSIPRNTPGISDEDRKQIQQLLDRYAEGYNQKNVKAIEALWPSIPSDTVKTIKEFFKDAKSVDMKIHLTSAVPAGKRVTIEYTQTLQFDLGGKADAHTVSKTMYVVKNDSGWLIDFIPNS